VQKTVGAIALYEVSGSSMRVLSDSQLPARVFPALALTLLVVWPATVSAQDEPFQVLLVHSFRATLPVNNEWYNGILRGLSSAPELRFEIDIEAPDLSRFRMICSVEYRFPPILGLLSPIPRSRKLTLHVDQFLEARPALFYEGAVCHLSAFQA